MLQFEFRGYKSFSIIRLGFFFKKQILKNLKHHTFYVTIIQITTLSHLFLSRQESKNQRVQRKLFKLLKMLRFCLKNCWNNQFSSDKLMVVAGKVQPELNEQVTWLIMSTLVLIIRFVFCFFSSPGCGVKTPWKVTQQNHSRK